MHIARRTFSFSMSHREWVGLSFRKNEFPKAPLRMRATIWLFVREKRVHTSQVNGCGPPRGLFPSGTRRGAGTHITSAGRDSSAVAPVVASVVFTFTRDTGTQITQTNLTSIPTHQHDRDDRIRGRLNQKNPLLKGSTEIPGCSHHRVRSEVASAPFRIWCSDVMHACSAGPLPGTSGSPHSRHKV